VSRPSRPPLNRLARAFRVAGIVALVLVFVYVGVAVYSASQLRGAGSSQKGDNGSGNSNPTLTTLASNGSVVVTTSINLTNPGFLPINSIQVSAVVEMLGGPVIAHGGSPVISVAPGQTATIPVTFYIPPLSPSGPGAMLATHDANLPLSVWVNVTYASVFGVGVNTTSNYTWGAPFAGLNATLGAPAPQGNGTVEIPVQLSFQDHANYADTGTISARISSASGQVCADPSTGIDVAASSAYQQTLDVFVSSGCDPSGGSYVIQFQGPGYQVTLPSEPIP
jgi:hypothetical protein